MYINQKVISECGYVYKKVISDCGYVHVTERRFLPQ